MGGKSKKVTVGYRYYGTVKAGIAYDVDEIYAIKVGDRFAYRGRILKSNGNQNVFINAPNLFGGDKSEGGIQGSLEVRFGDEEQQPSNLLKRLLGALIPADRGYVCTVFDGMLTAINPYPKTWEYHVRQYTSPFYPAKSAIILEDGQIYAKNPAHMLWESYTNEEYGSGVVESTLDKEAFMAAADTLYAENFGLCLVWKATDSLKSYRQQICDHIGARLFTSRKGLTTIKLVRDDYDVDSLPVFNENNGLLKLEYDTTNNSTVPSKIVVTYNDAITFQDRPTMAINLAIAHSQGNSQSIEPLDFKGLPTGELANRVAFRELKLRTSSLKRFNLEFDRRAFELDVGDVFIIRSLFRPINAIVRIERTEENFLTDGVIKIAVVEDVYGLPKMAYNPAPPIVDTDEDSSPAVIDNYLIMEVPYRELAGFIDQANLNLLDVTSSYIFVVAKSPKGTNRSYNMASRLQGATDFMIVEPAGDWCPMATINQDVGYTDTVLTFIDGVLLEDVEKGSAAVINGELVRIDNIDLVNNRVTIGRGCADTVPTTHAAGSTIWFYDGFEVTDSVEYTTNLTAQVKLLSNSYNAQLELSNAPTQALTIQGRQGRPYPPANVKINGLAYPSVVDTYLTVSWVERNRLLQADQLIDTTIGDIAAEDGTTYNLRFISDNSIVHSVTSLTDKSYTWDTETGTQVDYLLMQFEGNVNDEAGNVWTPTGMPVYSDGIVQDSAIRFNSGNGFTHLLSNGVISGLNFGTNTDFTIEFWFKLNARTNSFMGIFCNGYTSYTGNPRFIMFYGDNATPASSRGKIGLGGRNIGTENLIVSSTSAIATNTWTHCAITRNKNVFTLYLNGRAESTYTGAVEFDFSTNGTVIGRNRWDSGNNGLFTGDLDQLRVSRGCLYSGDFIPSTEPYTYNSGSALNSEVIIELEAVRDGLTSWQKHNITIHRS